MEGERDEIFIFFITFAPRELMHFLGVHLQDVFSLEQAGSQVPLYQI